MSAPILVSALALLTIFLQPAPQVLQVGDPRLAVAALQPYKARWKETLVNAIHQVIERGTWDDQLAREQRDGRSVLHRTIVVTESSGAVRERYEAIVDATNFVPIRSTWESKGLSYVYDYDDTSVRGTRVNEINGPPQAITASLPQRAFDYYGGMMELFLATLPRTPNGLFTFPAMLSTSGATADQRAVQWPIVRVFGKETVPGLRATPIQATRIEANTEYGFYKVWVTDVAPYVVRTVLVLAPGGRITYELLDDVR